MRPFGMVEPHMEPFTAFFALWQMLHQQTTSNAAAIDTVHRHANKGRNLFGLHEVVLRRIGQRFALKRDNTLIAATAFAGWLHSVKGNRKITLPEYTKQRRIPRQGRSGRGIKLRITAQRTVFIVARQKADRTLFSLCLQRKLAALFLQRRSQQGGQNQCLCQDAFNHGGVGVGRQNFGKNIIKPNQTPACIARGYGKAQWLIGQCFGLFRHYNFPRHHNKIDFCA